jgi:hypothetical protein
MTCEHAEIVTYLFADTRKESGLWACKACQKKFVPIDLGMEKDALRYRKVRKMNARQFADLFAENIKGGVPFDDLIDARVNT